MKIIILIIFVMFFKSIFSQHDHSSHSHGGSETMTPLDAPPHKGVVKQAGKYYIEVVSNWMANKNNTVIYLLKSSGVPVSTENVKCTVSTIKESGNDDEKVIHWGEEAFAIHLDPSNAYEVEISFFIKKKKYSAIFQTKGNDSKTDDNQNHSDKHHHH